MKTLKYFVTEKGGLMGKFIAFQIAMSFFGLMMFTSISAINPALMVWAGLFCIAFYASILGSAFWEEGAKDRIKADGGRIKKDVLAGLKIALVPYSPTILLTAVFAVLKANPGLFESATSILNILLKILLSGVYVPFDIGLFDNSGDSIIGFRYLGYCVITLGSALVSYLMGFNGFGEKKSSKR